MIVTDHIAECKREIRVSGLFSNEWYRRVYPDVAAIYSDGLDHYVEFGDKEGRFPNPFFDPSWYKANVMTSSSTENALLHYISNSHRPFAPYGFEDFKFGPHHQMAASDLLGMIQTYYSIQQSFLFDEKWYGSQYTDVVSAGVDPLAHYMTYGSKEGRWPNRFFDPVWYAQAYQNASRGVNCLLHYLYEGSAQAYSTCAELQFSMLPGRHNSPTAVPDTILGRFVRSLRLIEETFLFERDWYLHEYPNVAASGGDPLMHFVLHGVNEARNPNRLFDTRWYISQYSEVSKTGLNPLAHYIAIGAARGYSPHPFFPLTEYEARVCTIAGREVTPLEHFLEYAIPRGDKEFPSFDAYQIFRLAEENKNRSRADAFIEHINIMTIHPQFLVFIVGSDSVKADISLSSLYQQIYKRFRAVQVGCIRNIGMVFDDDYSHILVMNAGDCLFPHCLYRIASEINASPDVSIVYFDHEEAGQNSDFLPSHKPDWSPDLIESYNYIQSAACYTTTLFKSCIEECACIYDIVLLSTENSSYPFHIQEVLMRIDADVIDDPQSRNQESIALQKRLLRTNRRGHVSPSNEFPRGFELDIKLKTRPRVSVIIPTAARIIDYEGESIDLIQQCVASVLSESTYDNLELVIVDNGDLSSDRIPLSKRGDVRRVSYLNSEFNMAHKMNLGAQAASGEFLVTFNDDITVVAHDWIERMLAHFEKPHVGMVGARLFYPNDTLQHIGMVMSDGHMHHVMSGMSMADVSGNFMAAVARNCIAVTGAAAMIKKSLYFELDGYAQEFPIDFNDTDLCLRVQQAGYSIVVEPKAELYHYHAVSARRTPRDDLPLFWSRWAGLNLDPYYNQYVYDRYPPLTCRPQYSEIDI